MKKFLEVSEAQKKALEQTGAQLIVTIGISMASLAVVTLVQGLTEPKPVEIPQSNNEN